MENWIWPNHQIFKNFSPYLFFFILSVGFYHNDKNVDNDAWMTQQKFASMELTFLVMNDTRWRNKNSFQFLNPGTRGFYYKKFTIVNDDCKWRLLSCQWLMPQFGASLTVINYTPRVVNYIPRVNNYAPIVVNYVPRDINYAPTYHL